MFAPLRSLRVAAISVVVAGGLAVASCSGGSVATTPVATPPPTTTTQSIPSTGGTLALPTAPNGQTASIAVAAGAPAGVSITATSTNAAPAGAPVPSSVKRLAQSIAGAVPFLFVTFSVSANLSAQYLAIDQVSLVSGDPTTASYYVEFDDLTTSPVTKLGTEGPATLTTGFASFLSPTGGTTGGASSPTLTAGHSYLIQFYYVPGSATSSPSASPTASVSPTASPSPTVSPTASGSPTATPAYTFSSGSDTETCGTTCGFPIVVGDGTVGTASVAFSAPSPQPVTFNASWADSSANITPSGFPVYTGTGTAQFYFQISTTLGSVTLAQTPGISYEFPGVTADTTCSLEQQSVAGWGVVATASVSSYSAMIPAVTQATSYSTTPVYYTLVCH